MSEQAKVTCPACKNSPGLREECDDEGKIQLVRCNFCGGTAMVPMRRVCLKCGEFKTTCLCRTYPKYRVEMFGWEHSKRWRKGQRIYELKKKAEQTPEAERRS